MEIETHRNILLVEDEAIIALAAKKTLERYGFRVETVASGEKAVEAIASAQNVDLVLMDINLGPGIDGTTAAERILAIRDVPLVFLSSHTEREVVERTEGITSYGYIVKNSGETVLIASISMAFRLFEANRQAKEARNRLQATLDAIPDLMFIVDWDGYYRDFTNSAGIVPLAMDPGQIVGSHIGDVFPPEEVEQHLALYRACIETGTVQSHIYDLEIEGEKRFFDLRIARLDDRHILAIIRDVTEHRRNELRMEKLEQAIRQSPSTVVITDIDANIEYVNPKFTELTGYTPEEAIGENPRILQSGHTPQLVFRELWKTVTSGHEWHGSFRNRKKNGELYVESASIAPVKDKTGNTVSYIAVKEDITERVLAETRFKTLAEASPILIWESDEDKECIYFNAAWLRYTGRTIEMELGDGWAEGVHPEDLQRCLSTFHAAFDRREPFAMEYRLRRFDGTYGWVYDHGSPKLDGEGGIFGILGRVRRYLGAQARAARVERLAEPN